MEGANRTVAEDKGGAAAAAQLLAPTLAALQVFTIRSFHKFVRSFYNFGPLTRPESRIRSFYKTFRSFYKT